MTYNVLSDVEPLRYYYSEQINDDDIDGHDDKYLYFASSL